MAKRQLHYNNFFVLVLILSGLFKNPFFTYECVLCIPSKINLLKAIIHWAWQICSELNKLDFDRNNNVQFVLSRLKAVLEFLMIKDSRNLSFKNFFGGAILTYYNYEQKLKVKYVKSSRIPTMAMGNEHTWVLIFFVFALLIALLYLKHFSFSTTFNLFNPLQ
jgi:hypothetical protein